MKKLNKGLLIIITLTLLFTTMTVNANKVEPQFTSGGENHSHQYLVDRAIEILGNDNKISAYNYLNMYKSVFKEGADWPDDYETDSLTFKGHFFHAINKTNWQGGTNPTAMTRFIYYMNLASQQFDKNSSNNSSAILSLGKAMHYFADMNAPHHVSNLIAGLSNHAEWEAYADGLRNNYKAFNSSLYNSNGTNFTAYAQASANYAYNYVNDARATLPGTQGDPDLVKWNRAAKATYEYCQKNMAAVLDAFFRSEGIY